MVGKPRTSGGGQRDSAVVFVNTHVARTMQSFLGSKRLANHSPHVKAAGGESNYGLVVLRQTLDLSDHLLRETTLHSAPVCELLFPNILMT